MTISTLLLIIALVVFVVAAIGWTYKKVDLIAIGLALFVLSQFIDSLGHITLAIILLILAFIAFVLAAVGWRYKKVGLIAVGLALWVAAALVPTFIK
jgi:hypothetical protein